MIRLDKLTQKSQEALHAAQELAQQRNHSEVDVPHMLVALLEQPPTYPVGPSKRKGGGEIDVVEWTPGRIVLDAESDTPGLLVLSENSQNIVDVEFFCLFYSPWLFSIVRLRNNSSLLS